MRTDTAGLARRLASLGGPRRGLLGQVLVREGLISEAQLEEALRIQAEQAPRVLLGQILVELGAITQRQLNHILDSYHKKYRLGDILVETETITEDQLRIALNHQKKTGLRLGDVLLQLNFLTEDELNQALCAQFGVTFVDLDRLILEPDVVSLVGRDYAEQHRIIPIAKSEDVVVLAMDDPSDLPVAAEVEDVARCKVNVVTSTRAAFQRAFTRAYGESPEAGLARQHGALVAAHDSLRREHDTTVQDLEELRIAHRALLQERDAAAAALGELKTENAQSVAALSELSAAYDAMRREYTANTAALRELEGRHAETAETLADVEAAHRALLEESEVRARAERTIESLYAEASRTLTALRAAHETLTSEYEAIQAVLRETKVAHHEAVEALAGLQTAHALLLQENEACRAELEGAHDREATADRRLADQTAALDTLRGERASAATALDEIRLAHDAILEELQVAVTQLQAVLDRLTRGPAAPQTPSGRPSA